MHSRGHIFLQFNYSGNSFRRRNFHIFQHMALILIEPEFDFQCINVYLFFGKHRTKKKFNMSHVAALSDTNLPETPEISGFSLSLL